MQTFFRLFAILLVLMTGGVFRTLALATGQEDTCAREDGTEDCSDCAAACGLCACCPHMAAAVVETARVPAPSPEPRGALTPAPVRLARGCLADIFQPPRA